MNFVTKPEELAGKTISRAVILGCTHQSLALLFTDGSLALIDPSVGYEGSDVDIEFETKMEDHEMVDLGLMTKEEYDLKKKEQEDKYRQWKDREDRQRYLELKKKFEGPDCVFKETT